MFIYKAGQPKVENLWNGGIGQNKSVLRRIGNNDESPHHSVSQIIGEASQAENLLLAFLSESAVASCAPFAERIFLKAYDQIFNPGDRVDYVYFPESAVLSEFQLLEDGRMIETALIASDAAAGLLPVLSGAITGNWTQVLIGGSIVRIGAEAFKREMITNPQFQIALYSFMNNYFNQISQRFACNSFHPVEQRFCSWLITIGRKCLAHKLPLTQEQIARSLGVHRPTISLTAKTLQRGGIIDYRRGNLTILNRCRLEEMTCDCFHRIGMH